MQPPRALQTGLDVDWVFSESCIVSWKEGDSEPKHLGHGTQPVTLWFGIKQADHVWVILLQRTINLKISGRSIHFEFFLFVDPRSILFEKSSISRKFPAQEVANVQSRTNDSKFSQMCLANYSKHTRRKLIKAGSVLLSTEIGCHIPVVYLCRHRSLTVSPGKACPCIDLWS